MRDRQQFWIYDTTNGTRSTQAFGIYISGNGRWVGAEPDVEPISIPGRNGDLTLFNNRWLNVTVQYDCFILQNFQTNFANFRAYLQANPGYRKLVDSYNTGEYRMARVDGYLNINDISWLEDAGSFTVRFNCMPQRFLATGANEREIANNGSLLNDTLYTSKPMIKIPANNGGGTFTLTHVATGDTITVAVGDHNKDIYIDSESQDAYDADGASVNNLITLNDNEFPDLKPGQTRMQLSFSDPSMKIYVTPRWFTL